MSTYHRFSHEAMTTTFDALIVHPDKDYARQAAGAAFAEVERCETLLSCHDPATDVSQINRLKPGEWIRVSKDVLRCLEIAADVYIASKGIFDVAYKSTAMGTKSSAMNFLLLSKPDSEVPDMPSDFLVGIDPHARKHNFLSAEIDLGGIGKGFALDTAKFILTEDYMIDNALLNSGTSTVLAWGAGPEGKGWPVGISGDYREQTGLSSTYLVDVALSGSGTAIKGDHIKNPFSEDPLQALASWAKTGSAARTDALSTALMIMDKNSASQWIKKRADCSALVVYRDDYLVHGDW